MNELKIYIHNEVSLSTGVIEVKEWLDECIEGQATKSLMLTVFTELAQNILKYANRGKIVMNTEIKSHERRLVIRSIDHGPGIACIDSALKDSFSTSGTLGLGLPGIKRIMDELEIQSSPDEGTEVCCVNVL